MNDKTTSGSTPRGAERELSPKDYSEDLLGQFGFDTSLVVQTLVVALLSGIVAALLDEGLGLPGANVALTFGGMIGVLNGLTYACFKRCADRTCLTTALVNGWLATMAWYLTLRIVVSDAALIAGMDWFEATITGIVAGALGYLWYTVMHAVPKLLAR